MTWCQLVSESPESQKGELETWKGILESKGLRNKYSEDKETWKGILELKGLRNKF